MVAPLLHGDQQVGEVVVITSTAEPISHAERLVVATTAHALAGYRPHAPRAETPGTTAGRPTPKTPTSNV